MLKELKNFAFKDTGLSFKSTLRAESPIHPMEVVTKKYRKENNSTLYQFQEKDLISHQRQKDSNVHPGSHLHMFHFR